MRILILYPGATWSPYDVATGYENALRLLGHDVHVYNYHVIYESYRNFLGYLSLEHGARFPPGAAQIMASERAVIEILDVGPQVVLVVMGVGWHRRGFELVGRTPFPMALILTESPYMDKMQKTIIVKGHVGLAFTNDKNSVKPLSKSRVPVHYLPHSYDPARHYPREVDAVHRFDVFFHGTLWPERQKLFSQIDLSAYNFHVEGAIFGSQPEEIVGNIIDNEEMAQYYSGAKIALNTNRTITDDGYLLDGVAWSLGPRAFEIAACGAFQLCDDARGELREVFGDSVATFTNAADLQDKIDYYLNSKHDDEREEMAQEARRRVQPCSFENRARDILIPALERIALEV